MIETLETTQNTETRIEIRQWFPNFLARDPKQKLDVCPGPKH